MRPPLAALAIGAVLMVAACTTGTPSTPSSSGASPVGSAGPSPSASGAQIFSVYPVIVSTEQVVGPNRLLFGFVDGKTNAPAAAPDRTASVTTYPSSKGPSAAVSANGTFLWTIPDQRGIYRADLTFTEAGPWIAYFDTAPKGGASEKIGPFQFDVKTDASAIQVGEKVPSIATPTLADVGGDVKKISSDTDPDPAFYQTSEADAVAGGKPFVLVFATPAFCTSKACGPLLDEVKSLSKDFPDLTFINVEPYKLTYADGALQPVLDANNQLQTVDATNAFGILSEPWVYVVDKTGAVVGSFEATADTTELSAAMKKAEGA